ncbi:MAG: sulfite exporter TauE/SafE family protein [Pseudomonadota bacterium]
MTSALLLAWLPMLVALLVAGAIAGLSAGLFGVGGGFVVVPALLLAFGAMVDSGANDLYVAVGTSLATIIVTSIRSVQAHDHRGSVDFGILKSWAPWVVLGVCGGLAVAAAVQTRTLLMVFAVGVLLYAFYFLRPTFVIAREQNYTLPTGPGRAVLASGLGGFSALLGIGGGTPFVVTMVVCGRPVHQAVGTAAGVGFLIALPGAIGFAAMGIGQAGLPPGSIGYVNLPAFAAIALVSIFTAPLGAKLAHSLNELHLRRAFGVYLLLVSAVMMIKFVTTPEILA